MSERLRLLCVDDEAHMLRTLERFCRNEDIRVYSASSAADALALMESEPVDVVVSDYQMPGMNGLDFLHEVHARWPRVAGIIISGFVEFSVVEQALMQGDIVGFLAKPWQREELKGLIRSVSEKCFLDAEKGAVPL